VSRRAALRGGGRTRREFPSSPLCLSLWRPILPLDRAVHHVGDSVRVSRDSKGSSSRSSSSVPLMIVSVLLRTKIRRRRNSLCINGNFKLQKKRRRSPMYIHSRWRVQHRVHSTTRGMCVQSKRKPCNCYLGINMAFEFLNMTNEKSSTHTHHQRTTLLYFSIHRPPSELKPSRAWPPTTSLRRMGVGSNCLF